MPVKTRLFPRAALLAPLAFLSACMGGGEVRPSPAFAPTLPPPVAVATNNGAIFQASNGYAALTSGARAAQVGDVLTIALVERTQAAKSNSATTDRSGGFGLNPPTTGPLSLFDPSDASASGNLTFNGAGSAAQSNSLQGQISVTIAAVYPNGTMLVQGEKLMRLNRGDEFVQFSGIVRSVDIGPENIVPSTRVANARINYSGAGEIAQASRQGWLQRFFSAISPF
ncbi:MAG: flagellar basal body L-ring protein FlgH [Pseudomonadota bacterium]